MKLSDYLIDFIAKQNVKHIFQVIGGASVHMVHSIDAHPDVDYICVQHEQAGAMAVDAYSRMTKNLGVAMATSGPGMTNLITGIACAYFDSIPALYITGQVNLNESKGERMVRQVGFQETDIVDIVRTLTKYAVRIEKAEDIRYELEKALYIARSGRPGPVLIDIPMNLQRANVDPKKLRSFSPKEISLDSDDKKTIMQHIKKVRELIKSATRPVVIAGGGIRYADQIKEFRVLVDNLGFPVVSTWSGVDVLPYAHPLYVGQIGVYGNRGANFAVQNSDLIISIGSRLDTRITGGVPSTFAREAKKIVVDIDRGELYKKRGLDPDIGVCADVRVVIPALTKALTDKYVPDVTTWKKRTAQWKRQYPAVLPEWRDRKVKVDPYVFVETLSKVLDNNATVVTDCGANLTWTIQAFQVKGNQRVFSAMGNSPMGYSFAASLGASMALKKKPVVCIIGDGGLQINIQEFQTMVYYNIPIKLFILNNHSYGIIKQFQEMYFEGKYVATTPKSGYSVPDFMKIAKAYGLATATIDTQQGLAGRIKKVLDHKGPIVCEVIVPDNAKLIPKLEFGKPIEDLSPALPRAEFNEQMIIKPLE
jgi:acetolactate synthase-1/2/3 large subunit